MYGRCFSDIASRTLATGAAGSLSGFDIWMRPPTTVRAISEPPRDDDLLVGEELHAVLPVRLEIAEERPLRAAEGEERHRRPHADVHPDHRHPAAVAELPGHLAARGEDRGRLGVGALVHQLEGFVQVGGAGDRT